MLPGRGQREQRHKGKWGPTARLQLGFFSSASDHRGTEELFSKPIWSTGETPSLCISGPGSYSLEMNSLTWASRESTGPHAELRHRTPWIYLAIWRSLHLPHPRRARDSVSVEGVVEVT